MTGTLGALIIGQILAQAALPPNIDFSQGHLQGWEGSGFFLTKKGEPGPGQAVGACSADAGNPTKKGMLRHVLTIPPGPGFITFQAFAATGPDLKPDYRLDVLLLGSGEKIIPRQVWSERSWMAAPALLPPWQGRPRDYRWDISAHAGQLVQIVLVDQDDRPGCWIYAAGFRHQAAADPQLQQFIHQMMALQKKHQLAPIRRWDSRRFTALGNAGDKFITQRLGQCEIFYDLFYRHFQEKGFALHPVRQRLHLAVFDAPTGFEAFVGRSMPPGITGLYHTDSNRLALYDVSENRAFLAERDQWLKRGAAIRTPLDKSRFVDTVHRQFEDVAKDVGLATTMHEAAHLLSFNCGLLQRQGDAPAWLVEGLACYCEATDQGDWQALGAVNPMRLDTLRRALDGKNTLLPLEQLLRDDRWLRTSQAMNGYAQSWALFHQFMHQRPRQLKAYLELIHSRRGPDHRLTDFREIFGADLALVERRHVAYVRDLLEKHSAAPVR